MKHGKVSFRVSKRKNIFRRHSMRFKLIGGCNARYRSTNIIENKNNLLKNMLSKKVTGDELIKTMNEFHEGNLTELCFYEIWEIIFSLP